MSDPNKDKALQAEIMPPKLVLNAVSTLVIELALNGGYPFEHYYAVVGEAKYARQYGIKNWPAVRWHREMEGWCIAIGEAQPMRTHLRGGTEAWQADALRALKAEPNVILVLLVNAQGLGLVRTTVRRREGGAA